jgi:hypothetical protein
MRNVSDENGIENQTTNFTVDYFFFVNRPVYEIMLKNTVEPDRPRKTLLCMRIACWVTNATDAHCMLGY